MFGSTIAGQRATPVAFTDTPRNCWRLCRTSFWLRPPQAFKHCSRRPARCLSCSLLSPTQSARVSSIAWRGRAATSLALLPAYAVFERWLELLKKIAPRVTRVAVLRDLTIGLGQLGAIQTAAPSFGVEVRPVGVRDA